jgi:acyl-coenzyme A thioesterase PaaI-like protein
MSSLSVRRLTPARSASQGGLQGVLKALRQSRPTDRVRIAWDVLHGLPFGKKLFSWIIGRIAPYSGSIKAEVVDLKIGFAQVKMRDKRRLRNHLRSLHAIALANLAEFTGNIALAYSIPGDARFIVTRINMEYMSKARGEITATCENAMPADNTEKEAEISVELRDAQNVMVARGVLFSLVGPVKDVLPVSGR